MRALFIAFLIALLPVRGWVGDAMAIGMAAQGAAPAGLMAAHHGTDHAAGMDHTAMDHAAMDHTGMDHGDLHAAPALPDAGGSADEAGASHSHSACDVCNGPVIAPLPVQLVPDHAPQARRADGGERFASSLPRTGFKPPIS